MRVLEEQQRESHRKLQAARETKLRRESQRASVEQHLGDLKYNNGQTRAELERIHEMLSVGQRKMLSVRRDGDSAGSALRDFNEYVPCEGVLFATLSESIPH